MTVFDDFTTDQPNAIPRDRWGRPKIMQPNGKRKAYTRATTVAGTPDDRSSLEKWLQRETAKGFLKRPDLLTFDPDDREEVWKAVEKAKEAAGADQAANMGTMLHKATELLDGGMALGDIPLIEEFRPRLERYAQATRELQWLNQEELVVLDDWLVAGSPDRMVMWDGQPVIADLKTGRTLDYSQLSIAIQLAIYAHGDNIYQENDGEVARLPMPDGLSQKVALVIHLPLYGDACDIYEVDIERGWEGFKLAMQVREWRRTKNLFGSVGDRSVGVRARVEAREWGLSGLLSRLERMRAHPEAADALRAVWPQGAGKPDESWSKEDIDGATRMVTDIEAQFSLPF